MSRYRLMVCEPGGKPQSWVRIVDGVYLPMDTKTQARERRAEIRARHPGWRVWLERIPRCRSGSRLSRHYGLWRLDVWRMTHRWTIPWRPR